MPAAREAKTTPVKEVATLGEKATRIKLEIWQKIIKACRTP
jgi:hypothetical protein